MSGLCPDLPATHDDVARFCQIRDFGDGIDYLHSSPAALAVVITAVFGVLAYLAKPALERLYQAVGDRRRRRRLLQIFALEVANSAAHLRQVYSGAAKADWSSRLDEAARHDVALIPFQTYSESDIMSSAIKSELPYLEPVTAELIIRYYANDSLLGAAARDLRSQSFKELSGARRKNYYLGTFDLAQEQIDTCEAIGRRLKRREHRTAYAGSSAKPKPEAGSA